jgi:F-type H+-transporting ATPase subunit epsilon
MALHFELVSPARLLISGEVAAVQIPGSEGDMTILPAHAPVLSTLKPGVVIVSRDGEKDEKIFVRGGFAEVNPKGLTVLAETALPILMRRRLPSRSRTRKKTWPTPRVMKRATRRRWRWSN